MGRFYKYKGKHKRLYLPEHPSANKDGRVYEHRLIAEKILGKPLPSGVIVHHHQEDELVICEDENYHRLLHKRARAYFATGNPNFLRCSTCKGYYELEKMQSNKRTCKKCGSMLSREWERKNPERRRELDRNRKRSYRKNNREKYNAYMREYNKRRKANG